MNSTLQPLNPSTSADVVIRVENLYKEYRLGTISHGTLYRDLQSWWARMRGKEDPNSIISTVHPSLLNSQLSTGSSTLQPSSLNSQHSPDNPHFLALNDVSFEVKRGEVLGIIGRNGAGKSTLLKILSEVTSPTKGTVKIKGRVASLLEVGTGFHPELTGRENIYLNGAILGMTKKEIASKFDEIVAFAELDKFIDTPVKRYSSGMYVRLAFAVAAHLEPEILIVDEVLAVGDASFQKKCLGKMGEVAKEGRTVLFVSHNMTAVKFLCDRAVLLEQGTLTKDDDPDTVIEKYILGHGTGSQPVVDLSRFQRSKGDQKAILEAWFENAEGLVVNDVLMGSPFKICVRFRADRALKNPGFGFGIENIYGQRIFSLSNYIASHEELPEAKEGVAVCFIPELTLLPGNYQISLSIIEAQHTFVDYVERAISFHVVANDVFGTGRMLESSQGLIYSRGAVSLQKA